MSKVHPEIYAVKLMIKKTLESRDIILYCDIHGHSRQKKFVHVWLPKLKNGPTKRENFPIPVF